MKEVRWGIIGCGDVTENKSGPAFSKIPGSRLVAVMRRDAAKAEDYARRHRVPEWFNDSASLINHPGINAVYIATPPGSHADLSLQVAAAGKACYVEKPMACRHAESERMVGAFAEAGTSLFVAYYRRALPRFRQIESLLLKKALGEIIGIHYRQSNNANLQMGPEALPWRFQPLLSGGGLFVDLGSHTLDLMDYWFGPLQVTSADVERNIRHPAIEDRVFLQFRTANGIPGKAEWNFSVEHSEDILRIQGRLGEISCSIFGHEPLQLNLHNKITQELPFAAPEHIQQPLITEVVQSLLSGSPCCSTGISASRTNAVIDRVLSTPDQNASGPFQGKA